MDDNTFIMVALFSTTILVWFVTRRFWAIAAWAIIYLALYLILSGGPTRVYYNMSKHEVISYQIVEGDAVYLWVKGRSRPMYLEVSWDSETAKQLIDLLEKVDEQKGERVVLNRGSTYNEPSMFSIEVPQDNPPKQR